jgi:hypothetical protein
MRVQGKTDRLTRKLQSSHPQEQGLTIIAADVKSVTD